MSQPTLASGLARSAAGRLFVVFWGSLVVIDLAGLVHLPPEVATGAVVVLVALCSLRQAPLSAVAAAGMGWMFVNGFLVNHLGQLGWHGLPDLWRLLVLLAAAVAASESRNLDAFLTRSPGRHRTLRVPSEAGSGDPRGLAGREKHAVGR